MTKPLAQRIVYTLMALSLLGVLFAMTGCANTLKVLDGADAACADVYLEGYATDSRATGRILKVPEGAELNQATIEALCGF